ncbi:MAG TPA: ribonuclease HII [Anaerovoracaceae bacterium]|nr:ribonuclease HII [Anaerovoracaceae bacterium]
MKKAEREILLNVKLREKLEQMKTFEYELYSRGLSYIAGVDEVGRGPLAGPVVAAAVILPEDFDVLGVDDSKKLSAKKREQLYDEILEKAVAYGIGEVDNTVIDEINILEATKLAMREAISAAEEMLDARTGNHIDHILFDAISIKEISTPQTPIIKGDSKSVSIAAASIVAKVTRDAKMVKYHEEYPHYAFDSNKGYGTAAHYEGLKAYGLTPIHRKTFLRNINEK